MTRSLRERLLRGWTDTMTALGTAPDDPAVAALGRDLLDCWNEPHRDYHGPDHLVAGLGVLADLSAPPIEVVAWWFHDAVHHNDPPRDEHQSAELARSRLPGLLAPDQVDEVARLVLVTINHNPTSEDTAGHRICDADLAILAADWPSYQRSIAALRHERTELNDIEWDKVRIAVTGTLLNRPRLFHTHRGVTDWEQPARRNLNAERHALFTPEEPTR